MDEPEPARGLPPRVTLAIVVALFVVPILVAWWMARGGSALDSRKLVNHGTFLAPPLDVHAEASLASLRKLELAPGEWAMVHFARGACEDACDATVAALTAVRTVLGQAATRVRVVVLVDHEGATPHASQPIVDPAARARIAAAVPGGAPVTSPGSGVVFLDWRGQIMMYFADAGQQRDIKADIGRLLRGSKVK